MAADERGDRRRGVDEGPGAHSPGGEELLQGEPLAGVLDDDRHLQLALRWEVLGARGGLLEQRGELEPAPLPDLALDPDPALHQLDELGRDRQPEPGALVPSRDVLVAAIERREDPALLVGRNPGAGVRDGEPQQRAPLRARLAVHAHRDLAPLGELERVADEVDHHLPEPVRVADEAVGDLRVHQVDHLHPALAGLVRERPERLRELVPQPERLVGEAQLARLDPGEVEDVVDDRGERLGRAAGGLELLALLAGELGAERELEHPDHPVHRGADLVAHPGEEVALRPGRALRRVLREPELGLRPLDLVDVRAQADRPPVGHPAVRGLDPAAPELLLVPAASGGGAPQAAHGSRARPRAPTRRGPRGPRTPGAAPRTSRPGRSALPPRRRCARTPSCRSPAARPRRTSRTPSRRSRSPR